MNDTATARKLTGDEYMELLQQRMAEYVQAQQERIAKGGEMQRIKTETFTLLTV